MSFWSVITGTTPQSEQQAGLDAGKAKYEAAIAARQASDNPLSDQQLAAAQSYENGLSLEDTDAAAAQGFQEGLQEGFQNVLSAPGKAVGFAGQSAGSLVWGILKNIPWWVYIGLAVAGFLYFGGAAILARKLASKIKL